MCGIRVLAYDCDWLSSNPSIVAYVTVGDMCGHEPWNPGAFRMSQTLAADQSYWVPGACLQNDCDWYIPDNHLDAYGLVGGHVQPTDGAGNGALRIHLAIRAAYPSDTCGACL